MTNSYHRGIGQGRGKDNSNVVASIVLHTSTTATLVECVNAIPKWHGPVSKSIACSYNSRANAIHTRKKYGAVKVKLKN
jgi:hypothetical protein